MQNNGSTRDCVHRLGGERREVEMRWDCTPDCRRWHVPLIMIDHSSCSTGLWVRIRLIPLTVSLRNKVLASVCLFFFW